MYTAADVDDMVEAIGVGLQELPLYCQSEYDADRVRLTLLANLTQDARSAMSFVCFVLCDPDTNKTVGGVALYALPGYVTRDIFVNDIFFYVKPEWRTLRNATKLVLAGKDWGLMRGAKPFHIRYTVTNTYKLEGLGKLLARLDFVPIGAIYQLQPGSWQRSCESHGGKATHGKI